MPVNFPVLASPEKTSRWRAQHCCIPPQHTAMGLQRNAAQHRGSPSPAPKPAHSVPQGWINNTLTRKIPYVHITHIHKKTHAHIHTTYAIYKYIYRYLYEFIFWNVCYKHRLINLRITSLKWVCRISPILCPVKLTYTIGTPLTIERNWAGSWVTIR